MVEGKAVGHKGQGNVYQSGGGDLFPRGGKPSVSDGMRFIFAWAVKRIP